MLALALARAFDTALVRALSYFLECAARDDEVFEEEEEVE